MGLGLCVVTVKDYLETGIPMDASAASRRPSLSQQCYGRLVKQPWLGLAIALPSCFASGVLLAAFQAPQLLWLMACCVVLYLVWSTTEAIFLSNLWLMGIFAVVVGLRPWPAAWESFSAWSDPRLWALTLLGLWLSQTLLLFLVAFTAKGLQIRSQRRFQRWCMAMSSCLALSIGFWSQL